MQPINFRIINARSFLAALVLFLGTTATALEDGPDTSYLLDAQPDSVSNEDLYQCALEVEENYQRYHEVYGITWPAWRNDPDSPEPTHYESGGDSALFTGFYAGAATYRFLVTREESDLDRVLEALRGLHVLTHISGTPGVLVRCAFPLEDAELFGYPERWQHRIDAGFVYTSSGEDRVADILNPSRDYPQMVFFTRTSRDQMSGVLFGLSVAWGELDAEDFSDTPALQEKVRQARGIVRVITKSMWNRLEDVDFTIMDQANNGKKRPPKVTRLLKLQLAALRRTVVRETGTAEELAEAERFYNRAWRKTLPMGRFGGWTDRVNRFNNFDEYYAWNLRFARSYSVWLLEEDSKRRKTMARYVKRQLWRHVNSHANPHFTFLHNAMQGTNDAAMQEALTAMRQLALRSQRMWSSPIINQKTRPNFVRLMFCDVDKAVVPAHLRKPAQYFQWEKDPFLVGWGSYKEGLQVSPGLGILLPYWMGRYYSFIE